MRRCSPTRSAGWSAPRTSTWRCTAPSPKTGGVDAIPELAAAGISAFKLSTYEYDAVRFPRIDHPTMLAAFRAIAKTGLPVAIHNEDQELVETLTAEARAAGRTEPIMHCRTRPPLAETMADLEIFEMALETGAHVHIAHSSLARGFEIAETFRRHGRADHRRSLHPVSVHDRGRHRSPGGLAASAIRRSAPAAKVERMWASLHSREDRLRLHRPRAVAAGTQDAADIFACGAGLTGLQSYAPLMFSLLARARPVADTDGDLLRRAQREAARTVAAEGRDPRRLGLPIWRCWSAAISPFDEATIVDRPEMRWSPYHGRRMRARVAATFLRGQIDLGRRAFALHPRHRAVRAPAACLIRAR